MSDILFHNAWVSEVYIIYTKREKKLFVKYRMILENFILVAPTYKYRTLSNNHTSFVKSLNDLKGHGLIVVLITPNVFYLDCL